MTLPITISGAAGIIFNEGHGQGRTKPYISSAGEVYFICQADGGNNLRAIKSADPDTDTNFTSLAIVSGGIFGGVGTHQVGDIIHIGTDTQLDETIEYHTFSMATDAFVIENEEATSSVGTNVDDEKAVSISLETGGDIIIFYQGASDNDMGQKERVDRAYKVGASWTVNQAVDDGGANNFFLGGIVRGEADKFHFAYHDLSNNNALHKSVQDVDGTLSSVETYSDQSTSSSEFSVPAPVYYDKAGVERVTCLYAPTGDLASSLIVDDATPAAEKVASQSQAAVDGIFRTMTLAVDAGELTVHMLSDTANDLDHSTNEDDGSWPAVTSLISTSTIACVTANVYERDGIRRLAYIYDEGGAEKYGELELGPGLSAFIDAQLPQQNYHVGPFKKP